MAEPAQRPSVYRDVKIEDIDSAVLSWFDKVVDVHVETPTSSRHKVPVIASSGERWVTANQDNGVRDKNGRLILPIIAIRRAGINPTQGTSALGTSVPRLTFSRKLSEKTSAVREMASNRPISQRSLLSSNVYEISSIPFPFTGNANYELIVQAQYIEQLNAVIEKIWSELEFYGVPCFVTSLEDNRKVGYQQGSTEELIPPEDAMYELRPPLNEYYVVGYFDSDVSDAGNFTEFTDQERIVKFTTSFHVPCYLHLDPEGKRSAVEVTKTAYDVRLGLETSRRVEDFPDVDKLLGPK